MRITVDSKSPTNSIHNAFHVLPYGKFKASLAANGTLEIWANQLGCAVSFEVNGPLTVAEKEEHTGYIRLRPNKESGFGSLTISSQLGDVEGIITIGGQQVTQGADSI
jgi:hypothetical protein